MLCLSTWVGQDSSQVSKTRSIPCYAKLGGKYVGKLRFCGSTSAYQVLRDIQVQASKLLEHAWRDFDDIMAWCDNHWLIPSGFAYKDNLTQEEEEQTWSALRNAKRLEVMWDDNDEDAKANVSENTFKVVGEEVRIHVYNHDMITREVVGLLKRSRLPRVQVSSLGRRHSSFLKSTTFTKMTLIDTLPTDWGDCVNIEQLYISGFWGRFGLTCGIGCLRNLRYLQLDGVESLSADFGDLNLVCFNFGQSTRLELSDLVPHLERMPNLKTLRYHDNLKTNTSIPTELGNLVSLKILDLKENRFVGSIPTELGRLVNLTSLTIREYANFDLTCPQEVLNLGLAELVVERVPG